MFRAAFLVTRTRHFRPSCLCPPKPACASPRDHYSVVLSLAESVGSGPFFGLFDAFRRGQVSSWAYVGFRPLAFSRGREAGRGWRLSWAGLPCGVQHFHVGVQVRAFGPLGVRRRNDPGLFAGRAGGPTRRALAGGCPTVVTAVLAFVTAIAAARIAGRPRAGPGPVQASARPAYSQTQARAGRYFKG